MSGTPVLRVMDRADLPRVMEIERASFTTPWTRATFLGLLDRPDSYLVVAEIEGRVVAYAVFWQVLDQAELGDIAVDPEWRRRGVGARVLEHVLDRAAEQGVRELYLEVRESNRTAQRLYERYGFRIVGRRRNYYSGPREDARVLRVFIGQAAPAAQQDAPAPPGGPTGGPSARDAAIPPPGHPPSAG